MKKGHRELAYCFCGEGRHEILNDEGKERVHRDIGNWLSHVLNNYGAAQKSLSDMRSGLHKRTR